MSEARRFSGDLTVDEAFWRDHASWLKEQGYQLRSRYQPDWKPSWVSKKVTNRFRFEDAHPAKQAYHLMDATRLSDGLPVMFKKLRVEDSANVTREMQMNQLLSSGTLPLDEPYNHCVPIYEILKVPDNEHIYLAVMPFLDHWWPYGVEVPFRTIGEAVGYFNQLFEGVQFLHQHHIAHNDIKWNNIMVDSAPRYSRRIHPTEPGTSYDWKKEISPRSITRHPVKYFLVDFGLARQYDPEAGPPREHPGYGGDRSVPEFKSHPDQMCDPFPVDIYRLGNLIKRYMMSTQMVQEDVDPEDIDFNPAMDFMSDLVADMTQEDPTKRPNINEVVERFGEIVKKLGFFKLRSQFWPGYSGENWLVRMLWKTPRHIVSQVINFIGRYPAIPPTPGPPKGRKSR